MTATVSESRVFGWPSHTVIRLLTRDEDVVPLLDLAFGPLLDNRLKR